MQSPQEPTSSSRLNRRSFLGTLGVAAVGGALSTSLTGCGGGNAIGFTSATDAEQRALNARSIRNDCAQLAFSRGTVLQQNNGDEDLYSTRIGSFSKGLPHNAIGEVNPTDFQTFKQALDSRDFTLLDQIAIGPRKLENPQGGLVYSLQGADPVSLAMPPAPAFASAEIAGEIVELYWMALCRDVAFNDYGSDATVAAALSDLNNLSDFRGPKISGVVTSDTLFRSPTSGDLRGPYISQLLLQGASYGTLTLDQRQRTYVAGVNHMTLFAEWLSIQQGQNPAASAGIDGTARYIRNLRDLASYVHDDVLFEAYFNAALVLFANGVPLKAGVGVYGTSPSQVGFTSFGGPHMLDVLTAVANLALRAVWYQKWFVHRRLRPEAFAGRVEVHSSSQASYPLHADVLNSSALSQLQTQNGHGLLPMAYPEGSPRHPSYGAGHNTVAAACATVLKAFFDETFVFSNPVVPSADGLSLVPYTGPDAGNLTVRGEIDKLAGNIAQGRNAAGVHWRSDYTGSFPLGQRISETVLEEQKLIFNEQASFSFTRFDGSTALI